MPEGARVGRGEKVLGVVGLRHLCLALCVIFLRKMPFAERILQWSYLFSNPLLQVFNRCSINKLGKSISRVRG